MINRMCVYKVKVYRRTSTSVFPEAFSGRHFRIEGENSQFEGEIFHFWGEYFVHIVHKHYVHTIKWYIKLQNATDNRAQVSRHEAIQYSFTKILQLPMLVT